MFVEHILQASALSASEVIESKSDSNNILDNLYLQWAGSIGVAIIIIVAKQKRATCDDCEPL